MSVLDLSARIANEAFALAIAWHAVLAILLWRLAVGARPSRRVAATLLALPLASVSSVSLAYGNPFTGIVCAALTIALAALGWRLDDLRAHRGPSWTSAAGVVMMAFGFWYPHFLESRSGWAYLVGAPFGLLPCPTLSFLVGAALLGDGFGGGGWSLLLAAAGFFYGVVGVLWLGVRIDVLLVAGSLALATAAVLPERHRALLHRALLMRTRRV
jgi:hypothetical protein